VLPWKIFYDVRTSLLLEEVEKEALKPQGAKK
jgi:hypothetical protein